jgi:7-keto-8-aminopelargonate synthetase-like enzyme/acyl-CoA synthetase (AMP-forming)/AMP-acid ligase II/acyl carrier protein
VTPPKSTGSFFGPSTLVELLRHRATHQPDDRAFTYLLDGEGADHRSERHLTYAELDRRAQRIATLLQQGQAAGERVLLLFPPGLDYIAALFGCLYGGAVAVPAHPPRMNRSFERLRAIAADAEPRLALTTAAVQRQVRRAASDHPEFCSLEWLATDEPEGEGGSSPRWPWPPIDGETLAILQYTSGSTGIPKGVMLTHANLLHNSALIAHAFEHTRSGTGVFWLPGYHDMGLIGGILQPLYVGRPNVLMSPMAFLQRPVRWLRAVSRYGATTSGGPNFAYDLCVRKVAQEELADLDLSRWRVAFNGAEPIRAETLEAFAEKFAPCGFRREAFYPCYGLAEATLLVAGGYVEGPPAVRWLDSRAMERHRVADAAAASPGNRAVVGCGHSLPDQEIAIVDPSRRVRCADDQVGEIWLRGPSIAQGYWQRPDETREVFGACLADELGHSSPTYLRTGDLGFLRDGELFVTGRWKDLIIIRGQNHYPHDLERTAELSHEALRGMPGAAFTVDTGGRQRLVIVHEIQRGRRGEAGAAIAAVREAILTDHGIAASDVVLVRAGRILRTTSGKVRRHACRQAFLDDSLEALARWTTPPEEMEEAARRVSDEAHERPTSNVQRPTFNKAEMTSPAVQRWALDVPRSTFGLVSADAPSATDANGHGHFSATFEARGLRQDVLAEVRRLAQPTASRVTFDSTLAEAGLDSLGRMELLAALECRLGVRLPESLGAELQTVGDVADAVRHYALGRRATPEPTQSNGRSGHVLSDPATIPPEHYDVARFPEWMALARDVQRQELMGASPPYFLTPEALPGRRVRLADRELIDFSTYDYLGLAFDPRVAAAAKAAIDRYGTSVSGSRLVAGERPLHQELEQSLADWLGAEEAVVFVSGHATNVTVIGHLLGPSDLVLHDALAHNSIVQGCRLSGARRLAFPHNDAEALEALLTSLRGHYRRALVAIEGLYSMDGDVPDLLRFIDIKRRHKALLLVDEAHSLGVLGRHGRGIGEHARVTDFGPQASGFGREAGPAVRTEQRMAQNGLAARPVLPEARSPKPEARSPDGVDLWMGTLSKSLASCGGYIAGRRELVQYLKYTAPGFVYSVGISPPNAAAALEALRVLAAEPRRVQTLRRRAATFVRMAKERGLDVGRCQGTPVVPIVVGDAARCLQLWQALVERGVLSQPILPPAVPEASSRLRFFITCTHSPRQIREAVSVLADEVRRLASTPIPAAAG